MDRSNTPTGKQAGRESLGPARPEEHVHACVCVCVWDDSRIQQIEKGSGPTMWRWWLSWRGVQTGGVGT